MAKLIPLPSDSTLTRRAARIYDSSNSVVREDGRNWYSVGHQFCVELSAETNGRYSIEQVAAIVAVLSPRNSWKTNIRDARLLIMAALEGTDYPTNIVALNANRAKAIRILSGEDPFTVVKGPKVTAFWRNLFRDPYHVTVDVWILRAFGITDREAPTARQYRALSKAITRAAELRGETPSTMQAIIWIAVRGSAV